MKSSHAGRLLGTVGAALTLLLVSSMPASAAKSGYTEEPKMWPPPITDPSKAVPFSHPELNTANPNSPLYYPDALLGHPGTRFGSLGQRSTTSAPDGTTGEGQRVFGTLITTTTAVNYTYAKHKFVSDLTVPTGTYLYAPTLLGTNDSPLEIVTRYMWSGGSMKREIAFYDHEIGNWAEPVIEPTSSDYLDAFNYYVAEILKYNGSWYAMLYNFNTQQWETIYQRQGGSGPNPQGFGWER